MEDGVKVRGEQSPTRCPYCKDELLGGKELAACGDCGARQHLDCHEAHGACAACSSSNVLVPRARRAGPSYLEPLRGSTIRVETTDSGTRYTWPGSDAMPWLWLLLLMAMLIPMIVTIPIAIYAIRERLRKQGKRDFSFELTPDAIAFETFAGEPMRVRREDVGRVKATPPSQGVHSGLTIDVGVDRHQIYTTAFGPRLKPPELEWLADAINAWKDQA